MGIQRNLGVTRLVLGIVLGLTGLARGEANNRPPAANGNFSADPAAVQRHGPGWKYPQAGWLVVHIEGEPYERGYQHGRLLAAEIVAYIKTLAAHRSPTAPAQAWKDFRLLCQAFYLRRFDTEWLMEMKGIADGAAAAGAKYDDRRLDLVDIVAINAEIESSFLPEALDATATGLDAVKFKSPQYSPPRLPHVERCSAFLATGPATRDGRIVAGHITMSDLPFCRHYNVWLDIQPAKGHRVVFQTYPGGIQSGLDYYLSDSGLIVAETTIQQTAFQPEGQMIASRIRRVLQYAESIDAAVEMLTKSNNGLYTNEWLLGDTKTNEIAMFELGTKNSRLWRSSRNEWPGGTTGFYWGCNNAKDRAVLQDTVADLRGKPANLVLHPNRRDLPWQRLFERRRGSIDEAFGFEAFSTPPLVGYPSCDAKFTTAELAKDLKSWALFGPPLGRTWEPTAENREHNPTVQPLVGNDWTLITVQPPPAAKPADQVAETKPDATTKPVKATKPKAEPPVDFDPFPDEDDKDDDLALKFDQRHPFAWRGTLLPKSDADLWLAAAFAEYERIVSFENALRLENDDHKLRRAAKDEVDVALYTHESRAYAAARRAGKEIGMREVRTDWTRNDWYPLAVGQGVRLLADLRSKLGQEKFVAVMDEFGQAHAGQEVTTEQFRRFVAESAGEPAAAILARSLDRASPPTNGGKEPDRIPLWSIYSFEEEPEQTLIVVGTQGDLAAQREAGELLRRSTARRFNNFPIPIKTDTEVTDAELKSRHLLLVGRPATNRITAQAADKLPLKFGPQSFTVRGDTFAHPDTALIAAGENPWSPRYSVVLFAGLGARATWHCVQSLSPDDELAPQIIVQPAGRKPQRFCLRPTAKP